MGANFSRISFKMSENDKPKLFEPNTSSNSDDNKSFNQTSSSDIDKTAAVTEEASTSDAKCSNNATCSSLPTLDPQNKAKTKEVVPVKKTAHCVGGTQYQSNSSLSSGSGETSCVQLPWTKSAVGRLSKRRKTNIKNVPSCSSQQSSSSSSVPKLSKTKNKSKKYLKAISGGASLKNKESDEVRGNLEGPSSSCICTGYRRTNSDSRNQEVPGCSFNALELVPSGQRHSPPSILRGFNPEDYPIEDEDEKNRRLRAKEMAEGVELTDRFGVLSFKPAHSQVDYIHCLVPDLKEITSCSFYWGKIDRYAAEKLLENKPEGTFLLRDSAQEEYLFSVSFRRYGRSLHARIEQWNHSFSFDAHDPSVFSHPTVTGLIEHYKDPSCCMFFEPMLTIRLHRNFPFDLQHLARSVICNSASYDSISGLALPKQLKAYCREYHYKQRVRARNLPD